MHRRLAGPIVASVVCPYLVAGCSTVAAVTGDAKVVEVTEVRRLTRCNTAGDETRLTALDSPDAVQRWQAERGVDVLGDGDAGPALPPGPFVMIEYGERPSGGYGISIRPVAEAESAALTIHGTFLVPGEQQARAQIRTSPCVLVALPAGSHYRMLRLLDQAGDIRAQRPDRQAAAPSNPMVPAQ